MPPLSDRANRYLPSHVATAASQILAAYLAHNRVSAIEAARLAVRVESVLAELLAGGAVPAAPQPAEVDAAPRPARRTPAAKSPPVARPRHATAQAVLDLAEETVAEADDEGGESAAPAAVPAPETPARTVEAPEEIDLLTGGPLPPAHEPDYPAMTQSPVAAGSAGTAGKKRKRPPRPAAQRRAARVAAIEKMLVDGEDEG